MQLRGRVQPYSATWAIRAQPQMTIRASSAIADEAQARCRLCLYALLNLLYHSTVLRHIRYQSCCLDPSTLDLRHLDIDYSSNSRPTPRYATRLAMTALHHLYPKYRAHAASRLHRRRYSPQSFVYTVLLFSALGLAGYLYPSGLTSQTLQHSYTSLNRRDVGPLASTDEDVRCALSKHIAHISNSLYSVVSSTRLPINVAT